MPKLSINDLRVALTADYTAQTDPDDKASLLRLRRDSIRAHNLANEMMASLADQSICKGCMMGAALDTLSALTTPFDASEQEKENQEHLIVAFLIQEALEKHRLKSENSFERYVNIQSTTH